MRIVQTPDIEEVAAKIGEQYLRARTMPETIKKPLSYAIYKVWEEYNRHEKDGEYSWKY